ncbi:class D beta-lactamase [Sphingobacterium pedocola]|uniref:Beta-lactamase n=1 Tax=Sphingobacterium pedocola TaxID=2082722 RepID=A0ABR9T4Z1_9SPHI|nr:class D beta-lactamase [Sphingobacterium pedocola]MBE8719722.1 class D beta-lactamase [Sphingobacterium pedocola]
MIRLLLLLAFTTSLVGCGNPKSNSKLDESYKTIFDGILDTQNIKGSILIYDPQKKIYYSNDFDWANKGFLPASTFKIPNAIVALETSIISSDSTVIKWNGEKRAFESWEKDLTFREAFQASCVPCFQEIARNIGVENMKNYLNKLHYPTMDVRNETLDNFWLYGNSRITQMEQIDFLQRFYTKKLPILTSTRNKMLKLFQIERTTDYTLNGKTGWSYNEKDNNGWFVGFFEKGERVYYFALNVVPKDINHMEQFAPSRVTAIREALHQMKLL